MTRDEIIKLAREAAARHGHTLKDQPSPETVEFIVELVAMAAAAEREQCAITAWGVGMGAHDAARGLPCDARDVGSKAASAIRARSQASTARMCPSTYYECSRGCGDGGCKDFSDAHGIGGEA